MADAAYRLQKLAEDPLFDRKRNIKSHYGLDWDDYVALLDAQDHKCPICDRPFGDKTPCVDHCHESGRVRGLLCRQCNTQLGWYEARAPQIADYLASEEG